MLQEDQTDDYVSATGKTHSVREFLELVFQEVGLPCDEYVETDPRYLRPSEVDLLLGDASKTKEKLGWSSRTSFEELVRIMVASDWEHAKSEALATRRQAA